MLQTIRFTLACTLLVSAVLASPAQGDLPEYQDLYVNDFAGLLSPEEEQDVRELFQNLREEHDVEATLVTIESVEEYGTGDETVESFTPRLFDAWGIGDDEKNNGVLFLVAVEDRRTRIELGAGFRHTENDEMQGILDEAVLPHFRNDDYGSGLLSGAITLARHFGGPVHVEAPPGVEPEGDHKEIALTIMGMILALGGLAGWTAYRRSRKCPECGKIAVSQESKVLEEPTEEAEGKKEVRKECGFCGWAAVHVVTFTAAAGHGGGSGGGGSAGGGSFGGGISGGGGASGGW